jgi:hypothetical protein
MPRAPRFLLKISITGLLVLTAVGAAAWIERGRLLSWYYVRQLQKASGESIEESLRHVNALGAAAVPRLLDCLRGSSEAGCANATAALDRLVRRGLEADDASLALLPEQIADAFPGFSASGRKCALGLAATWLMDGSQPPQPRLRSAVTAILEHCAAMKDSESRLTSLRLVPTLMKLGQGHPSTATCRGLVAASLGDDNETVRLAALHLALDQSIGLKTQALALLKDPSARIRRETLAALGPMTDLLATDDLLAWLYDPDRDVQAICELALRARGLGDTQLRLGRMKASPDPRVRLGLFAKLPNAPELDQGVWLRSLSHDASPAVRAAALRSAVEQDAFDLTDRLEQMRENDPSATVRQLAQYYLSCQKYRSRAESGN